MSGNERYYDARETRDPGEREAALRAALPKQIAHAKEKAPAFTRMLAGVDPAAVTTPEALARLPVTRKSQLSELQASDPPFGGFAVRDPQVPFARVFTSPGPIYEPEAARPDYWRMARALFAAGFRKGDLVHNTFAYHMTPAGSMVESGAQAIGCTVFPAGVGQTELQARAMAQLKPQGFTGTPSFLKALLDKARELGVDVSSLAKALVSGEALPPSLRGELAERGVGVLQCYATADLGLIAYESEAQEGLIADEDVVVEIVRPGTGEPVPTGEVGEVVVTMLNPDYPLVRFATGDLSAIMEGTSPCGRTNLRIRGWMGRADQTTKVRGMFVHPSQVADVLRRHSEVHRGRLLVDREGDNDVMTLRCEVEGRCEVERGADELAGAIAESIREVCKLRGRVEFVDPGVLPNDGKVIEDVRKFE